MSMTKPAAIVSLLWPRYFSALETFCAQEPGTVVLVPSIYFDKASADRLEAVGCQLVELESLLDAGGNQRIHDSVNINMHRLAGYFGSTGWEDGCSTLELEEDKIKPVIQRRVDAEMPAMTKLIESLNMAAGQFDIRLMVVSEDVTAPSKTAVMWARGQSVPSLQLMHGVALAKPYTVHGALFTDALAVYGQRGLESYLDIGVDPKRCHVTGNPAWDAYTGHVQGKRFYREQLAQELGLDSGKPWVVLATTWAAYLTTLGDPKAFEHGLTQFFEAARDLREAGIDAEFIIKDRPGTNADAESKLDELAAAAGLPKGSYHYSASAAERWVVAADVVVGMDSNLQVEAMIAGTPVVNLLNWFGLRLGPSFDVDSGVIEVAQSELAPILAHLVTNEETRTHLGSKVREAAGRYNIGIDGQAHRRVAELMRQMQRARAQSRYIWQELLDVEHIDSTGYHDGRRPDLVEMFTNEPRFLLDIGCSAGGTGLAFKEKYPQAKVWGIEINQSAATKAASRLDRVLCGKFEDFDLVTEGIEPGTLDAVIIADVLEHMYNPWDVLMKLKPLLSPKGQIVTSIPNTRNAGLMEDLARGYWRYDSWGLLDITHIRFFTFKEIKRFFHETGYRIMAARNGIDPRLKNLYDLFAPKVPCDIDCGKMVLKGVTLEELGELCSLQFYTMVELGAAELDDYNPIAVPSIQPGEEYQQFLRGHLLTQNEVDLYEKRIATWSSQPRAHIAVLASEETIAGLSVTIASLARQLYYNVRLTVIAPFDCPDGYAVNERMGWHKQLGSAAEAINAVLTESDADWVGVVQSGDELVPHALLYMVEGAQSHPDWVAVYSDEDQRNSAGVYSQPYFKPDFCPDYFLALPYISDFFLIRKQAYNAHGGLTQTALSVAFFELLLKVYESSGARAFGHIADVLYHRADVRSTESGATGDSLAAGQLVLQDSFRRQGVNASVEPGRLPGTYRIRYRHEATPKVSVIVLTREHLDDLRRCVEGLFQNTDWPDFELVLIDNGSEDPEVLHYLAGLDQIGDDRLRVYRLTGEMNFSRLRNQAASVATGDYLLFLDNDTAPVNRDWLSEMMAEAMRPEIGVVGARLIRTDGTVDDAGRILGMTGGAESPFIGMRFDEPGYYGRLQTPQNYSAVSSSCMLIRRALFQQIGGFDENFDIFHADNDLCLRVGDNGQRILWTPYANLVHAQGASLSDEKLIDRETLVARGEENRQQLYHHWLPRLGLDPAYNQNLALQGAAFSIEKRTPLTKRALPWKPLPRLLSLPADNWGCGNYRIVQPHRAAIAQGKVEGWMTFDHFLQTELSRMAPDTIVLQRQVMDHQVQFLREYKRQNNMRLVFETDDLFLAVPKKSIHRADLPRDMGGRLRNALQYCDRFLVTTEPLKAAFADMHEDIRVVPNSIDFDIWGGLKPQRRTSAKPRVGWAGGVSHGGDLEVIYDVVRELADEVDWVFFGMCPEPIKQYIKEFKAGVPFEEYPIHLASMNLDLALAPLEYNAFNECKSNLRILEYGILGYPMIGTDILPYQGDYPITVVPNNTADWVNAIREHINDLDECARRGDALRQYVIDNWLLENHIDAWMSAWFEF